jgi:subtilisin family serine protease
MPTPPARRREPCQVGPLAIVALAATAALVVVASGGGGNGARAAASPSGTAAEAWSGFVGDERAQVAFGQRQLVILRAPSLADRVGRAGRRASDVQERSWTRQALAQQRELISRLALQGVVIRPDFSYVRVVNGFSAPLDPRAVSLLERMPEVRGLYPVRAVYPASVRSSSTRALGSGSRGLDAISLPGATGRGVTVALLDTGVDRVQPLLAGRVKTGYDVVDGDDSAVAEARPGDPTDVERHGTELAGLVVGKGRGARGVARSATVLPIRVAGWQRDVAGDWAVYGRTDQLIAGLERAVDPNGDGDAHDAARIALVGLAEPFAGFAASASARAVTGAARLDTLVVVPAGNDGPAGPVFGSVSGPGGAAEAVTVGAADLRSATETVPVALAAGLDVLLDGTLPLVGAVAPEHELSLAVAAPRNSPPARATPSALAPQLRDFFSRDGVSLVAGRAALVPAGTSPGRAVENATIAGAHAVLLYGGRVPPGALGLNEDLPVPVVGVPTQAARAALAAARRGGRLTVAIGAAERRGSSGGTIAAFSSRGLAFDGRVKPDVAAPGVALSTVEPGTDEDGSPRVGTVNGSSAAAAAVAGAAALLAQARPSLDAAALKSLLVASAKPLEHEALPAQGTGLLDLGAAAASELALEPSSIAFGRVAAGSARRTLVVRNVSMRRLSVRVASDARAGVEVEASPATVTLAPGARSRIRLVATLSAAAGREPETDGVLTVTPRAGIPQRVPWSLTHGGEAAPLLAGVALSTEAFRPSDTAPAVLSLRAGRVVPSGDGVEIRPVARLEIELWTVKGENLGVLARLRDLVPVRLAFGLTGRGPRGAVLRKGLYRLRVTAVPTGGGPPSREWVTFRIR